MERKEILNKMTQMEIARSTTEIIQSFLKNITFRVKIEQTTYTTREIKAGVRQGCVLGPTLFNIMYTSDIQIDRELIWRKMYADDIATTRSNKNLNFVYRYSEPEED